MAGTTLTPPAPPAPPTQGPARKLDAELSQASRRIRAVDLLRGALALAVITLAYVTLTMILDRAVELPAEARLVGLVGYALAALGVGYFAIYRPLARKLNPRYTARRIEETAEDAKNAVINYVDLQDASMTEAVRARLAARAAQEVGAADTRRLSESKSVVWLLVGAGLLAAALAVCFLVFRPGPFWSLLKRAVHPYTTATIATKTELELLAPELGDASVLSGDSLTVRAHVGGRLPDAGEPDEPRLLVRYSPEGQVEEYALEPGATPRDLARALPPRVLQNGLFYRVSAGDATTPEYRIDVRPRPAVLKSSARYEYPAYTRLKPETADGPTVEALRGTAVALTATANRPFRTASLSFESQGSELAGEIDPADPTRATFRFTLGESTSYRVRFTSAEGDPGEPFGPHAVKVARDDRPVVTITAPKESEIALPANGLLAVDGIASDDFGLTQVRLRMQLAGPRPSELQSVFYKAGKSLKRPSDGTDPARLEVQLSQPLGDAKFADGRPANLAENAVIEYYLEALDNCTVPNANAGRSDIKRVKLGPPETAPPAKRKQDERREQRKNQEQEQQKRQDQKQEAEARDPNQPRPDATDDRRPNPEQKPPDGQKPSGAANQKSDDPNGAAPKNPGAEPGQPPQSGDSPPQPGQSPEGAEPPKADTSRPADGAQPPQPKDQGQKGQPQSGDQSPKSPPQSPEQERAKQEARDLQTKLNQERGGKPESAPTPREQSPSREEIEQAARDLNSADPDKKKAAEEKLDQTFGKDARQRAQQEAEQLKKDLNSADSGTKQKAEEKLKDLAEKAEQERQKQPKTPEPKDGGAKPGQSEQSSDPGAGGSGKQPKSQPKDDGSPKSPKGGNGKAGDTPKPGDDPSQAPPGQQQGGGQSTGDPKQPKGSPTGKPDATNPNGRPQGNPGTGESSDAARDLTNPDPTKRAEAERKLDEKVGPKQTQGDSGRAEV